MATFMRFNQEENTKENIQNFDVDIALKKNGWRPHIQNPTEAEKILAGMPMYTYLLRPNIEARGFSISFVGPNGQVKHDHFKIIDPVYGIWRNGMGHHVGRLEKVICDMMDCATYELRPL